MRTLAVSSVGRLQADTIQAQNLALSVSSSGWRLLGQVQAGAAQHRAAAGRYAAGRAQQLGQPDGGGVCAYSALGIGSSGRLNAQALAVQDCRVRVSGSGSCQVNVARTLDAHLSSSGSALVSGHPQLTSRGRRPGAAAVAGPGFISLTGRNAGRPCPVVGPLGRNAVAGDRSL